MVREPEYDFPGRLAGVLASVAAELGSVDALVASRPGSWEAASLLQLAHGTVGWDDEQLSAYKLPDAKTAPGRPAAAGRAALRARWTAGGSSRSGSPAGA